MDYRKYRLSVKEKGKCIGMAAGASAAVSYLFYDNWWGLILFPVILFILYKREMKQGIARVQEQLGKEFLDVLRTVSAALLAGLSMENAWQEAGREVIALHGENSIMGRELAEINHSVRLNVPLEQQLENLAGRSGNSDIASFAEVFSFAKRSGGNFIAIIEGTSNHIRARYETEREIEVLVAAKKMEQNIMNVIPMLILAYLKVSSLGFMDVLYGNVAGVLFMSVCLLAYGGAILLSERILQIKI